MTPLEEQVENLARAIAQEQAAQMGEPPVELAEMPNDIRLDLFAQAEAAYYALLPLEVTDESVTVPRAALAQVMAIVRLTYPVRPESLAAEAIRQCNAALTQKGEA